MSFSYTPPPSLEAFHLSDKMVRVVRGPLGSAKSTAMAVELMRRAALQEPGGDGVRRTRFVIVRNTLPQLKSTCLETIRSLFRPIMRYRVNDHIIQIRVRDIESDWILLPMDSPENIQRLLSLELTGGWISELREIDPQIFTDVRSRCGRYPAVRDGGPTWYGIIGETNSFSEDSPWNRILEENLPTSWDYFVQPGARSGKADWLHFLVDGYYENQCDGTTKEWQEQYIDNMITPSLAGEAVFRSSFAPDFHLTTGLEPIRGRPAIVGMDTARHPAVVIGQIDGWGKLNILDELERGNCGVEKFVAENLMPLLHTSRYSGVPVFIVFDPSSVRRGEVGEESVLDMLKRRGFQAFPAQTNFITPRIRAVEKWLLQQRDGKAAMRIDKERCPQLALALGSKYRYKKKKSGELESVPDKVRPWADLCFVAGTQISTPMGDQAIETLTPGDLVTTPRGSQRITATGHRSVSELLEIELSTGVILRCTPNHPFVMADGCVLQADGLQYGDVLEGILWAEKSTSSGMTENGSAGSRETDISGINSEMRGGVAALFPSTVMCGWPTTAPFQTDMWCITGIMTRRIIGSRIWSLWSLPDMLRCMYAGVSRLERWLRRVKRRVLQPLHGMAARKDWNGTGATERAHGLAGRSRHLSVLGAAKSMKASSLPEKEASAELPAREPRDAPVASMTKPGIARSAAEISRPISMARRKHAPSVVGVRQYHGVNERVYNLTVATEHRYYAGGVLVLNCDALEYLCLGTSTHLLGRVMSRINRTTTPEPSVAGWT